MFSSSGAKIQTENLSSYPICTSFHDFLNFSCHVCSLLPHFIHAWILIWSCCCSPCKAGSLTTDNPNILCIHHLLQYTYLWGTSLLSVLSTTALWRPFNSRWRFCNRWCRLSIFSCWCWSFLCSAMSSSCLRSKSSLERLSSLFSAMDWWSSSLSFWWTKIIN